MICEFNHPQYWLGKCARSETEGTRMSDLQKEMEAFFAEYTERWNNQDDYSSLIEIWDQDERH